MVKWIPCPPAPAYMPYRYKASNLKKSKQVIWNRVASGQTASLWWRGAQIGRIIEKTIWNPRNDCCQICVWCIPTATSGSLHRHQHPLIFCLPSEVLSCLSCCCVWLIRFCFFIDISTFLSWHYIASNQPIYPCCKSGESINMSIKTFKHCANQPMSRMNVSALAQYLI